MKFINSFSLLGDDFYHLNNPTPVHKPSLFLWNKFLAEELGIDGSIPEKNLAPIFAGNEIPEGALPLSMAYAGHQFGQFSPQLGDGRAHLLGDIKVTSGRVVDIQLKGSGTSQFSRGGDGRCALGPAIREYIVSEAMHALGVPTTRCLAVVLTGEPVYRDTESAGAVVTRVAASHIRVGSFEYFAARGNYDAIKALAEFVIQRHFPEIDAQGPIRYLALIEKALDKQIALIVEWMRVGFIHGVMNTDNTTISGETIDYGPCAFMGKYSPKTVFSSIDHQGRYAFGNQPAIVQWNMSRFAENFIPLIDDDTEKAIDQLRAIFESFPTKFEHAYLTMMASKLGFKESNEITKQLVNELLTILKDNGLDYTKSFDQLTYSLTSTTLTENLKATFGDWLSRWQQTIGESEEARKQAQAFMRLKNPVVIPRNHHVEAILENAIQSLSTDAIDEFLEVLRSPYTVLSKTHLYQDEPGDGDRYYQTYCGT
ncbi:MAG: YdiU family protein [Pseudomonadales bacterium]|nr:YdiU family protein [Pseudomonadales bacterium]